VDATSSGLCSLLAFGIHGAEPLDSTTRFLFLIFCIALNFIQVGQHLNCNDKANNNIQSSIFQMEGKRIKHKRDKELDIRGEKLGLHKCVKK
jgi:hypothetical protein